MVFSENLARKEIYMVERREKEEVQQGLCMGHRKQRPLFLFCGVCVCAGGERMAGLCRANEDRRGR